MLSTPDGAVPARRVERGPGHTPHSAADAAGESIDWVNPLHAMSDRANLGIAGHSLGASAVSVVAQCSDESDRWQSVAGLPKERTTADPCRRRVGLVVGRR